MAARWTEYLPLDDIARAERNPKGHAVAVIDASMKRHGYIESVVLDERTGRLAGGHGRLETLVAARAAGDPPPEGIELADDGTWLVPVGRGWASASDADADAALIALNRTTELGGWDTPELGAMLRPLADLPDGLAGVGYSSDDIDAMLAATVHVTEHDRHVPDPREPEEVETRSQIGDCWLLGPHRLVCGDSRNPDFVRAAVAEAQADQIWTDPPYGVAYQSDLSVEEAIATHRRRDGLEIVNDSLSQDDLRVLLHAALGAALEVAAPGATIFVTSPPGPLQDVFAAVLTDLGVRRHTLVWVKDRFAFGRSDYHYRHEILFYGWKPDGPHQPPPDRTQDSVWEIPRPGRSEEHPTMKPVELVRRAIANHTKPGGLVLDPFGGSGTTLLAADILDRRAALIEIDPRYCDVILDRWERHGGTTPTLTTRDGD